MTSLERKENSERLISSLGIPLNDSLPVIDDVIYRLHSPQDVAKRILIITYLNCVASDASLQQEVMMFLIREKLWDDATPDEKALFHKPELDDDEVDDIFWQKESLWMLLWAIGKADEVGMPDHEVDLHEIFPLLPGFFTATADFIQGAHLRDRETILERQDFYFRLNGALRQAPGIESMIPGVVHERDVALSWLTGILGEWI